LVANRIVPARFVESQSALVSEESREITGRVFRAGKVLTELARKARKNAGMDGMDLD
jgi:hypothetical protein